MNRSYDFEALVGDLSFSITYRLDVTSQGQNSAHFENTGLFSLQAVTPGVHVSAVPEPAAGLLLASGLVALVALGRGCRDRV